VRICLLLIADPNGQQANRPNPGDFGLDCSRFMRLNNEQQGVGVGVWADRPGAPGPRFSVSP
jgi:hypothetical protein